MASVFLAERLEDGQQLVLKILDSKLTQEDDQLQRFMHEFSIISQFDSPHIVKILEQGFTDDHVFIAMEYFERGDLKQRIQQGVTRRLALQVLFNIGQALEVIHGRGIIHRDLKPQNVMFRADGTLAVADFGISKEMVPNLSATLNSSIMGTPFYISPEMVDAMKADERSDLYSLGVIFYEMLMGRRPFEATSVMMLLYKHMHEPVPSLPAKYAEFQPLIDRLLAKRPEQRFQNAGVMLAFLNQHWHAYLQ
jgi:serine/threonine protein kinase